MTHQPSENGVEPEAPPTAPAHEPSTTHRIPGDLFRSLVGMGFSENAVKKSIVSGCINEESCLQWLTMHNGHPELDTPLDAGVVCEIVEKQKLTPEELERKVAEMKAKAAEVKRKADEDERQRDRQRELQRISEAKGMREAKEEREKKQRLEAYEEVRKQKAADAVARERVQIQIATDKLVRQGMDPERAALEARKEIDEKKKKLEEEQRRRAEERERERQEYEAQKGKPKTADAPQWNLSHLILEADGTQSVASQPPAAREAPPAAPREPAAADVDPYPTTDRFAYIAAQINGSDPVLGPQCLATLKVIIANILQSPFELKFRTIKKSNAVFTKKIAPVPHAVEFLLNAGFRAETSTPPGGTAEEPLLVMRTLVQQRLRHAANALSAPTG